MWIKKGFIILFLIIFLSSCNTLNFNSEKQMANYNENDVVAIMKTTNWTINILMETDKAPITTTNFIWLAKKWYYDGIIFHRIIKGFMIQGWDPDGTWMWGVSIYGEKFDDEFHPELKNDKYTISMANSGPNTNGSQFFINTAANNFLDNKHSVFWRVIEWFEAVDKLEKTKTETADRPVKEVKMIKVEIKQFKNWKLDNYDFNLDESLKKIEEDKKKKLEAKKDLKVKNGDKVSVHYTWTLEDKTKFDSSLDRWIPLEFVVWAGQMIKGFDEAVLWMKIWDKKSITLSPSEAYWERDDSKVQVLEKSQLKSFIDAWIKLEVWVELPTNQGNFKIVKVDDKTISVDINHPLAWKTLNFDIELIDIK
jgi:cyclophilin family peptidyl-prolyl cis-trans isomerase/FKBP-type peptidyl-prolyl cis-trans isomerase 2